MASYPVYAPPFRSADAILTEDQAEANYDYFLREKARRVEYLAGYLAARSVDLRLDAEALPPLDSWLYRYGGHLVPLADDDYLAMATYDPEWIGDYPSLNVINDLGIFAGDYIATRNKHVRWGLWLGRTGDQEKNGFQQPCLFGLRLFAARNPHSMLHEMYSCCDAGRFRLSRPRGTVLADWDRPGELVRRLQRLSDPNPPAEIPFSQRVLDDP